MKTKEKITKKTFDAVQFMRDQRDRITKEIVNMSSEETIDYFERQSKKNIATHNNIALFNR